MDARTDAVMVGVRTFSVRDLHVVHPEDAPGAARAVGPALSSLHIGTRLHPVRRGDLPGVIDAVAGILNRLAEGEAVVNLSSGWEEYSFAALSAAFLTGTPAFVVQGDEVVPMPVLRVSYPDVLSPAKLKLLRHLALCEEGMLVRELAEHAHLSPSLVSYHLRGYRSRPGLEAMGLVESAATDRRGHVVQLTPLGRNLLSVRPPPDVKAPGLVPRKEA